jgi:four helix bundle protein
MLRILPHLKSVVADSLGNGHGIALASPAVMNPKAEELKRRTFKFALDIIAFCRTLRETWEGRELSDQLFRAGTRVGANYRAACRGLSHRDFVVKIGRVVEEADETCYWLELIQTAQITSNPALGHLRGEAGELTAIFSQSQLTAKANAANYAPPPKRPFSATSDNPEIPR